MDNVVKTTNIIVCPWCQHIHSYERNTPRISRGDIPWDKAGLEHVVKLSFERCDIYQNCSNVMLHRHIPWYPRMMKERELIRDIINNNTKYTQILNHDMGSSTYTYAVHEICCGEYTSSAGSKVIRYRLDREHTEDPPPMYTE